MISPTDDKLVTSSTSPMSFTGYTAAAGAPVQLRAWNFTTRQLVDFGAAITASTTPTEVKGSSLYAWSGSRTVPSQFWKTGHGGHGKCARVGATTTVLGGRHDVIPLEVGWVDCYNEQETAYDVYENCRASNHPVAAIFTSDWDRTISGSHLTVAASQLGQRVSINLDNYTPTAYEHCHPDTPELCPPGGGDDPETYKYFNPNASFVKLDADEIRFSINPSRKDPMTVYIDDMATVANNNQRFTLTTSGGRLVLGINFEANGPEIRMNCIRNGWCGAVDGMTLDFTTPRADLAFELEIQGGRVRFKDLTTTFITGSTDGNTVNAGNTIATELTRMIKNDSRLRNAVNKMLDEVVRGTLGLADSVRFDSVRVTTSGLIVRPTCQP